MRELQWRTSKLAVVNGRGPSDEEMLQLGHYTVSCCHELPVTETISQTSLQVATLAIGDVVRVLEIEELAYDGTCDGLSWITRPVTRARVESPPGWVTIRRSDPLQYFALPPEAFEAEALAEQEEDVREEDSLSIEGFSSGGSEGQSSVDHIDLTTVAEATRQQRHQQPQRPAAGFQEFLGDTSETSSEVSVRFPIPVQQPPAAISRSASEGSSILGSFPSDHLSDLAG